MSGTNKHLYILFIKDKTILFSEDYTSVNLVMVEMNMKIQIH